MHKNENARRADEAAKRIKRERMQTQADTVAELLGVDPEDVMFDSTHGVVLTPNQMDALLSMIPAKDQS